MPNEHAPKHLLCLESCLEFVMASTYTIDQERVIIYGVLLVIRYLNQHVSSFTSSGMELSSLYVKLCNSI
jgi:hypothetical protein